MPLTLEAPVKEARWSRVLARYGGTILGGLGLAALGLFPASRRRKLLVGLAAGVLFAAVFAVIQYLPPYGFYCSLHPVAERVDWTLLAWGCVGLLACVVFGVRPFRSTPRLLSRIVACILALITAAFLALALAI